MFKNNKYLNIILLTLLILLYFLIIFTFNYYSKLIPVTQDTIISKILPPLLSAFVSGIVAFTIFYLTKLKDDSNKIITSNNNLSILIKEINNNLNILKPISTLLNDNEISTLSESLETNPKIKETFKLYSILVSIDVIDKFIVQLNTKDYGKVAKIYSDYKTLLNLLDTVTQTEAKEIRTKFLEKIDSLLQALNNNVSEFIGHENESESENENNKYVTLKQLIVVLVVFSLANYFTFKLF